MINIVNKFNPIFPDRIESFKQLKWSAIQLD